MVSSVIVELMGDAGEAPSRTKSGEEGVKALPGGHGTTGICEEDIFRMKIKGHVTIPNELAGTHSVDFGVTGDTSDIYKKRDIILLALFWSVTVTLTRPSVCALRTCDLKPNH